MTVIGPQVSIILPTYNGMPYLREAIESVRSQTFSNWELMLIDDGSTDDSLSWLESVADSRIRILRSAHTGNRGRLRNRGLANARGEWIAFNDSDDRWRPQKLERQLAYHSAHPALRWSYTGRAVINRDGQVLVEPSGRWKPHSGAILKPLLRLEATIALPSVFIQRALLEQAGGFWDQAWGEDYELWIRLAQQESCGLIDEPLVEIRSHPSTSAGRPEVPRAYIEIYRGVDAIAADPGVRRIARREQVRQGVRLGRTLIGRRDFRRAFRALIDAFRIRPFDSAVWRALFRGLAIYVLHTLRRG